MFINGSCGAVWVQAGVHHWRPVLQFDRELAGPAPCRRGCAASAGRKQLWLGLAIDQTGTSRRVATLGLLQPVATTARAGIDALASVEPIALTSLLENFAYYQWRGSPVRG